MTLILNQAPARGQNSNTQAKADGAEVHASRSKHPPYCIQSRRSAHGVRGVTSTASDSGTEPILGGTGALWGGRDYKLRRLTKELATTRMVLLQAE